MSDHAGSASGTSSTVHRIEVRPSDRAGDPLAAGVLRSARALGVACHGARTARVYLVQGEIDAGALERVRTRLLTDPVLETSVIGATPARAGERTIEVHPLPGVMDPAAQTVRDAIRELTGARDVEVVTGTRYDLAGLDEAGAAALSRGLLANGVIEQVHHSPWTPRTLPRAKPADQTLRRVALTTLSDDQLMTLSRQGHLFLSLAEMKAVQAYYLAQGREPTDIELETIAQTWSEHCVHKTLKSTITYRAAPGATASDPIDWSNRPNHQRNADGSVTIKNLLKSTVAAATFELIKEGIDWTLSVFVDNAGVIAFDERHAINVKVETHNRPSAIEPYGGAATGIGGCIRDVIGTGLGARPIAATDVFCVADPREFGPGKRPLPSGVLEPRRVLTRVVDGVRDYGNRMGIPTVSGAVWFDDRYVANPLVFCGCIGLMDRDKVRGEVRAGDRIIAIGGRTGRDGIHGATFSSAELTDTHADEFSHAVQIGNAIEEKRLLDAILRARDAAGGPLFDAITDCGAGGFSSAVGEMGKDVGAEVHLDRAPLKYEELRYDEIWISESQERMVLAVPEKHVGALRAICEEEGVEIADLGVFGTPTREIVLRYKGAEVGRLSAEFLHEGIPMPVREAVWDPASRVVPAAARSEAPIADVRSRLLALLAHPNIASKRWIIRQYDHEVQGNTVLKPIVGPGGAGPGDASVIRPVADSQRGLAISCGLATSVGDPRTGGDAYLMAIAAVDECVRNLVCVGADPARTAILDNFCWPGCDNAHNLATLVRAAEGCYDAAKAYRTPFISGKDSLHNQFRYTDPATGKTVTIEIPPTLLITGVAMVDDVRSCITMDAKHAGGALWLVGDTKAPVHHARVHAETAAAVARAIRTGAVCAAHDCSEGGVGVAVAEMLIAGEASLGATINAAVLADRGLDLLGERAGLYVLEVERKDAARVSAALGATPHAEIGVLDASGALNISGARIPQVELRSAFLGTLDW